MQLSLARVGILAVLLSAIFGQAGPLAQAAPAVIPTFIVNSAADVAAGGLLTNGICETPAHNGICTLRAAIMKANHFPGGGVTIILPALPGGAAYLLILPAPDPSDGETGGDLNITGVMTITGGGAAGTIIDASGVVPATRVLSLAPAAVATISGVTIQGGNASTGSEDNGGGIFVNLATLTLKDSTVTGNRAVNFGGGIENEQGVLAFNDVTVSNNNAVSGGGIDNAGGRLDLVRSTVMSNTATTGGGVVNTNYVLNILDSTLIHNGAALGGGLFNASSLTTLINSTIGDNQAADGGGIFNHNFAGCCTMKLYNVTIAANQASGAGGGISNTVTSTVFLQNTILSNNTLTSISFIPSDCSGTLDSGGYNDISSTAGDCHIIGTTTGNHLEQFALLRGPQDNGGPTQTFALLKGSPAIDAGNPSGCTDDVGAPLTTDQRGAPRPAFGGHSFRCDIGAYELQQMEYLPVLFK